MKIYSHEGHEDYHRNAYFVLCFWTRSHKNLDQCEVSNQRRHINFIKYISSFVSAIYLAAGRSQVLTLESIDDVISHRESGLKAWVKNKTDT